jgi:hypothetical protein
VGRPVKLKPCPFCGKAPMFRPEPKYGRVPRRAVAWCFSDGHEVQAHGQTDDELTEAWNRRATKAPHGITH